MIVQGRTRHFQKSRERRPMAPQLPDRFAQTALGFDQPLLCLLLQPFLKGLEDRRTLGLVIGQAFLRIQLLFPRFLLLLVHRLQRLDYDGTFDRAVLVQLAEFAPSLR